MSYRYITEILSVHANQDGENLTAEVVFCDGTTETIPGEYCVFECEDEDANRFGYFSDGWACDAFFYNQSATVGDLRKLSKMVWDAYHA